MYGRKVRFTIPEEQAPVPVKRDGFGPLVVYVAVLVCLALLFVAGWGWWSNPNVC